MSFNHVLSDPRGTNLGGPHQSDDPGDRGHIKTSMAPRERGSSREREPIIQKDSMARRPSFSEDEGSPTPSSIEPQAGVKKAEAVSLTWTLWGLITAYIGYALRCSCVSRREVFQRRSDDRLTA